MEEEDSTSEAQGLAETVKDDCELPVGAVIHMNGASRCHECGKFGTPNRFDPTVFDCEQCELSWKDLELPQ